MWALPLLYSVHLQPTEFNQQRNYTKVGTLHPNLPYSLHVHLIFVFTFVFIYLTLIFRSLHLQNLISRGTVP